MKRAVNQLVLGHRNFRVAFRRPVFQRIGIFTYYPFAGAGGVEQDRVKAFRQRGAEYPTIEMGQRHVADSTAADVGVQDFNPAGGIFIGGVPSWS